MTPNMYALHIIGILITGPQNMVQVSVFSLILERDIEDNELKSKTNIKQVSL